MKINHAILHVFDFVSCVNVYAQEELDLSSKNAKRYVTSHAKKALGNIDSKRGEFAENSMFACAATSAVSASSSTCPSRWPSSSPASWGAWRRPSRPTFW